MTVTDAGPIVRAPRSWVRIPDPAKGMIGVAVSLVAWEIARAIGLLPTRSAPSIGSIATTLVSELIHGDLATALFRSARTWFLGLGASLLVALPIGMIVGISRWADALTTTVFDFIRPVPAVAFVPVAIVLLGLGARTEVFLVVLASVWPIIYNVRLGIRGIDPMLLETARTLRLGRLKTIRRVRLPALLPPLFTGLRVSAGIAVVLVVVAELVATGRGLGYYVELNRQTGSFAEAWAGLVLTGGFGFVVAIAFTAFERRVIAWHHLSSRAAQ